MNVLLVIAEERAICASLRAALPDTDLILFEATIEEGLRRLIAIHADAILVDDTPSLDPQALARIQEAAPATPILVLASRGDGETLAHFTLAGARACLAKPFSCDELREAIAKVLRPQSQPRPQGAGSPERRVSQTASIGQHQTALRWLSRLSGHIKDPTRLCQSLIDALSDVFDAVRCAVLLEGNGSGVRVVASHGIPAPLTESLRLGYATGLMRWLEENACLTDRAELPVATDAVKEMQVTGARLAVPILLSGRVRGAILVGEKASGRPYTDEERELLTSLARCASTSFENAELYQDVSVQRRQLDTVLANVTAGVVVVRTDRTVALMNQSAERVLQLRAADVLGRSVQKLGSGFADVALRTLADGQPHLRQTVKDQAIDATLGLSATPLGEEGVVVIFSKLPEERASAEDVAYSPFWEYLSSRVAQEIKNPMVAVNTFAQLLPRKYESEDFREAFAETVQQEVSRINSVVETLFDFARHPRLVLERTDVNDTVRNVLKSFEDELRNRAIEVEVEFAEEAPEAEVDPVFFSQALHNVVQNSIDAMPSGGAIKVATRQRDNGCEVVVGDTGPGIAEQDSPSVFMPFFSTKEQGMGLGLTVANRIMKQHSGELALLSAEEGGGSAFAFRLPSVGAQHADNSGD
jgi:signal transduction histidine kinase/DNA-binding NarL/FixJ family response regulator